MPRSSAALYYNIRPFLMAGIATETFWTLKDAAEAQGRCGGHIVWSIEAAHWDAESGVYLAQLLLDGFHTRAGALDWILDAHPEATVSPRWDGFVVTPISFEVLVAISKALPRAHTDYVCHMARRLHHDHPFEAEPLLDWHDALADRVSAVQELFKKGPQ